MKHENLSKLPMESIKQIVKIIIVDTLGLGQVDEMSSRAKPLKKSTTNNHLVPIHYVPFSSLAPLTSIVTPFTASLYFVYIQPWGYPGELLGGPVPYYRDFRHSDPLSLTASCRACLVPSGFLSTAGNWMTAYKSRE